MGEGSSSGPAEFGNSSGMPRYTREAVGYKGLNFFWRRDILLYMVIEAIVKMKLSKENM